MFRKFYEAVTELSKSNRTYLKEVIDSLYVHTIVHLCNKSRVFADALFFVFTLLP